MIVKLSKVDRNYTRLTLDWNTRGGDQGGIQSIQNQAFVGWLTLVTIDKFGREVRARITRSMYRGRLAPILGHEIVQ